MLFQPPDLASHAGECHALGVQHRLDDQSPPCRTPLAHPALRSRLHCALELCMLVALWRLPQLQRRNRPTGCLHVRNVCLLYHGRQHLATGSEEKRGVMPKRASQAAQRRPITPPILAPRPAEEEGSPANCASAVRNLRRHRHDLLGRSVQNLLLLRELFERRGRLSRRGARRTPQTPRAGRPTAARCSAPCAAAPARGRQAATM